MRKSGVELYAAGHFREAEAVYSALCARNPGDVDAWLGLGQARLADGRPAEALAALDRALPLVAAAPAVATVQGLRARAAAALGHTDMAERAWRLALGAAPSAKLSTGFATFLVNEGRVEEAEALLVAETDLDAAGLATYATVLTQSGRAAAALARLGAWKGAEDPPLALARARAGLALGRGLEFLPGLQAALGRAAPAQRAQLFHAAARVYDQADDIPRAVEAFSSMHLARGVVTVPGGPLRLVRAVAAAYPGHAEGAAPPPPVAGDPRPLFICGLPRSGTSLCEQGLAAHPDVHAAGERDELRRLSIRLGEAFRSEWPACAVQVPRAAAQGARMWRAAVGGDRSVVTDKMPDNVFRLGLAAQLLPEARAVILLRDPLDALLSCWQQAFGPAHAWTATWEGLAEMAAANAAMIEHWQSAPPMPLCLVRYEDLVARPESEFRDVLEFAGLEWDARVVAPERVGRTVRTASALQVRERIHTRSIGRWRRYEAHLAPLRQALHGYGIET